LEATPPKSQLEVLDFRSHFVTYTLSFRCPSCPSSINPYADIRFTANRLPHWQQEGAVYFVTFRLADTVPHRLRTQWESEREAWLHVHPEPWSAETEREYHVRFSGAIERWLDVGHGSCILRRHDCAEIVAMALRYFDGKRAVIISSVVMPNHVHALFVQNADWPLEKVLRSWKSFSSRKIKLAAESRWESMATRLFRPVSS
jgi:putative transposase